MITRDKYLGIPGPNGPVLSRCNYLAVFFLSPSQHLSYIKTVLPDELPFQKDLEGGRWSFWQDQ